MKTLNDLVREIKDITSEAIPPNLEQLLETLAELPEPETRVERSLRMLLVDMAIEEYLSNAAKATLPPQPQHRTETEATDVQR